MTIAPRKVGGPYPGYVYAQAPRNVYWEITLACDLACRHCRANAQHERDPAELSTDEGKALVESVKELGSLLILTGGDPMKRADLFELMEFARGLHVPVAITPSTTPTLTRPVVSRFAEIGVTAMGISLDGPSAEIHDGFRNVAGTFDCSMRALAWAKEFDIPVQVNTTVTADTIPHLQAIYDLLRERAAPPVRRWSLFVLVPVGRGVELGVPTAEQIEDAFAWVYDVAADAPFHVGTVEAPQYRRFWIQQKVADGATPEDIDRLAGRMGFGVRDGNGVIFVSHKGEVYPAGFLPFPLLGNVRERSLTELYRHSPALQALRDATQLKGRCGVCEYKWACGGSRARAYAMFGDPQQEDPLCVYQPAAV
jgi:radical SAM protein